MITITNKARQRADFHLEHDVYCVGIGHCECKHTTLTVGGCVREFVTPPVLTLLAREVRRGLPPCVAGCIEIRQAKDSKHLAITNE